MAYDGWLEFNGVEIVNLSRTAQLSSALGIDVVWVTPGAVQWIEDALGGADYDVVTTAPWYDPNYPASAEFAGVVPLAFPGLDDSTAEATTVEYITDGGKSGKKRNTTLPIVASVALVASTDRGAEYGKRWLDRVLRNSGAQTFCSGAELRFFRYKGAGAPVAHRRDVSLTRGSVITRKRSTECSVTWLATFTLTCGDPYVYGDAETVLTGLGGGVQNLIANPGAEVNTTGWTRQWPVAGDDLTRDTTEHHSGVASFKIVTAAGAGIYYDWIPASPGYYSLSFWVKGSPGTSVKGRLQYETPSTTASVPVGGAPWVPLTGSWQRVTLTTSIPLESYQVLPLLDVSDPGTYYFDDVVLTRGEIPYDVTQINPDPTGDIIAFGSLALVQESCPVFDYTPVYDPLYPALVPSPTAPDFYPAGWDIADGMTFDRFWARVTPPEPSTLNVVPVITLSTTTEARMVRVSIWDADSPTDDQCDPLFGAVVSYLPPNVDFYIDGEQHASYLWDGFSAAVRRTDSLVYSPDAKPVEWTAFNDPESLLVTLDLFSESGDYEGSGDVRLSVAFVPKSD